MRKNTLIKMLAVLVMCLVIGAAFVACNENVEVTVNDDVKVIVGVALDKENNLVVTYNDSTTYKVALPKETECEHRDDLQRWWTLDEHDDAHQGTYLKVCSNCQDAWILYENRHRMVEQEKYVAPTCTADGYTAAKYCADCSYDEDRTEITKLGHDWVLLNDVANVCETGATYEYKCSRNCGEPNKFETKKPAVKDGIDGYHTVKAWAKSAADQYVIEGYCTECHDENGDPTLVQYTVPAFLDAPGKPNTVAYSVELTKRNSCRDEIKGTFTLLIDGKASNIVYNNVLVSEAGKAHQLKNKAGELVDVFAAADTLENSNTYSTAEFAGIKGFADKPVDSCEPILAYYVCEAKHNGVPCNAVVDVYAYSEHKYELDEATVKAATCTEAGYELYKCKNCSESYDKAPEALGHDLQYSKSYELASAPAGYACDVTCSRCDFTDVFTPAEVKIDKTTTPVSCESDGIIYVTYTLPNKNEVTDEYAVAKLGHHLNGVLMFPKGDANEKIYAWTEGCDILEFDNEYSKINPDEKVVAYFFCDDCNKVVDVWAQIGDFEPVPAPKAPATGDED